MNQMPDREKVIKGLECAIGIRGIKNCGDCPYDNDFNCVGCDIVMRDALALLKEQEWNMLTEDADGFINGLPGDDGQYLMTDGEEIWIDDYVDGVDDGVFLDSGRDIREIKAWMYMPKLPKKGQ